MDVSSTAGGVASLAASTSKQVFGAQVVAKTLDYMNQGGGGNSSNADYDFQTKVLSAAFAGKGTMVDMKV